MLTTRIVSSLEKCMHNKNILDFAPLCEAKILGGERFSFQLLLCYTGATDWGHMTVGVEIEGGLPFTMREVVHVPNSVPVFKARSDDNYLSHEPGIYPDLLMPSPLGNRFALAPDFLYSVWFDIDAELVSVGTHKVTLGIYNDKGERIGEESLRLTRIDKTLPKINFKFTEWFHCDTLANYYGVEVWSDEHFRIVENFAKAARRQGMNMILTPIHTPPLDTAIGGERTTTQLVRITKEHGKYRFAYDNLDRFLRIMDSLGFEYFEMAHLFTQWGAKHAPKIVLTREDGTEEKIFGWETEATGEDYADFLSQYIPALIAHLKEVGVIDRVHFHISDEPNHDNLETYIAAKNVVRDLIAPYPIMDAASSYDLYRDGFVDIPIPSNDRIGPYLENHAEGLWTYYCCCQTVGVANNLIAMPAYRTRTLAYQLYKYRIVGFLQWGFNFYSTFHSIGKVNPFSDTTGCHWVPGGDPFVVYPAPDGTPYESMRLLIFGEVMTELRLLYLVEEKLGYDKTLALVESYLGTVVFDRCATASAPVLLLHNALVDVLA